MSSLIPAPETPRYPTFGWHLAGEVWAELVRGDVVRGAPALEGRAHVLGPPEPTLVPKRHDGLLIYSVLNSRKHGQIIRTGKALPNASHSPGGGSPTPNQVRGVSGDY